MALKSTIHKVQLNVADTDRGIYGDFALTVARHPSETVLRLMIRLLAFALNADEALVFGRGISTDNEPDIWLRDATGHILLWVELGNPDPERLRKACGLADRVVLYAYGNRSTAVWWQKHSGKLARFANLAVYQVGDADAQALESLCGQNIQLQCTISDGTAFISDETASVAITPEILKPVE